MTLTYQIIKTLECLALPLLSLGFVSRTPPVFVTRTTLYTVLYMLHRTYTHLESQDACENLVY